MDTPVSTKRKRNSMLCLLATHKGGQLLCLYFANKVVLFYKLYLRREWLEEEESELIDQLGSNSVEPEESDQM